MRFWIRIDTRVGQNNLTWTVKSLLVLLLELGASLTPCFPLQSQPARYTPTCFPSCSSHSSMVKLTMSQLPFSTITSLGQVNHNQSPNAEDPPHGSYHTLSPLNNLLNGILPNGVVTPSVVVGSVFFATDKKLWVEESAVGPSPDLIWRRLRPHECHWHKTPIYQVTCTD